VDCYAVSDQFRKTTEAVRATYGPDVKVICFDMKAYIRVCKGILKYISVYKGI
jgi:hypothetical protein